MHWDSIISALIYIVIILIAFWIAKILYAARHRDIDVNYELVKKDNLAFALTITGFFFGILLSLGGVLSGPSNGFVDDIVDILVYFPLSLGFMFLSSIFCDKVILHKFNNQKEIIVDQNAGTGFVEFAIYTASGLICFGALHGEQGSIFTAIAFWLLGMLTLFATTLLYNKMLPFDIHEHIEKDNVAVGISFAGALIAMGNIIRFAIQDEFVSWQENLGNLAIYVALGLVLLPCLRWFTDKILLPGENLTDEIINQTTPNYGAATIEAFSYISASFLISWCF